MAVTSAHLEKACDKLLRWCSAEFRNMGRDAVLEVPVADELSEAVRRLRSRPELLAYVVVLSSLPTDSSIDPFHPPHDYPAMPSPCSHKRAKPRFSPPSRAP
jgi:hypothetical protein